MLDVSPVKNLTPPPPHKILISIHGSRHRNRDYCINLYTPNTGQYTVYSVYNPFYDAMTFYYKKRLQRQADRLEVEGGGG